MFSKIPKSALAPPHLSKDDAATEVLRVWVTPDWGQVQMSVLTHHENPAAWGLALVDIARHVAKAYALKGQMTENEALERIKQLFDAEWKTPTDIPEGRLGE
jgi:hypothetical protein